MAGSILEQFAELKSDYEIGKASRYKRTKTGIMTLGSHADYHYRTEAAYFGALAKWGQAQIVLIRASPNTVRHVGCYRQASSTLAVECLRKTGHEGTH
jgi:hypothetical protein